MLFQHRKLFLRDRIRSPCLYRELHHPIHIKMVFQRTADPFQLLCGQCRRSSSADVDGLQLSPWKARPLCMPSASRHLMDQRIDIVVRFLLPHSDCSGRKGAIQTDTWAEWNPDIQGISPLRMDFPQNPLLSRCDGYRQPGLPGAHKILSLKIRLCGCLILIVLKEGRRQLHRPDPCQISPRKRPARQ